jgi:hypothetical protein
MAGHPRGRLRPGLHRRSDRSPVGARGRPDYRRGRVALARADGTDSAHPHRRRARRVDGLETRHRDAGITPHHLLLGGRVRTPCGRYFHDPTAGTQSPVYVCRHRLQTPADSPDRCGCRSIRVQTLDDAVWSQIRAALTTARHADPNEGRRRAGDAGNGARVDIGADTLAARIADAAQDVSDLQHTIAAEYHAARQAGFDPATARLMLHARREQLTSAQHGLDRLQRIRGNPHPNPRHQPRRPAGHRAGARPHRRARSASQTATAGPAIRPSPGHRLPPMPDLRRDRLPAHPARLRPALATELPLLPPPARPTRGHRPHRRTRAACPPHPDRDPLTQCLFAAPSVGRMIGRAQRPRRCHGADRPARSHDRDGSHPARSRRSDDGAVRPRNQADPRHTRAGQVSPGLPRSHRARSPARAPLEESVPPVAGAAGGPVRTGRPAPDCPPAPACPPSPRAR